MQKGQVSIFTKNPKKLKTKKKKTHTHLPELSHMTNPNHKED